MLAKVISFFIILIVGYFIIVFMNPGVADKIDGVIWVTGFSESIRELKSNLESGTGNILTESITNQITEASGAINGARESVKQINESIDQTKATINTKIDQTKKVIDSVEKTKESISELRNNVSELTSFSGITSTGSTNSWATTASSSGSSTSQTRKKNRSTSSGTTIKEVP